MRRLALISGMLLTLTAGVWSSALAAVVSAGCAHDMSAFAVAAPASDEHDCCRAKVGKPNAPHSEHSPATAHAHAAAATHEHTPSQPQADDSHARPTQMARTAHMNCVAAEAAESESKATRVAAAFGERGRSCFECCAGRANQTPTNATLNSPEQNKVKRDHANANARARDSFADPAPGVSHLAPSQHAPPAPRERRHTLISVFLI